MNSIRFVIFCFFFCAAALGFWMGNQPDRKCDKALFVEEIHPTKTFPLTEHKSFAIILYAYNQAHWCERALRSIFEQDYEYYRVILIDDGSVDGTSEKARHFIVENQQDHRVILIRNETHLGPIACLYRAIDGCLDREIALPMEGKDWLPHSLVLTRIDAVYQNPDVWLSFGQTVHYPTYEVFDPPLLLRQEVEKKGYRGFDLGAPCTFYAGLMRQIRLQDLLKEGRFATSKESYLIPLLQISGGRFRSLHEPVSVSNSACCFKQKREEFFQVDSYKPLAEFPKPKPQMEKTDVLLFSYNRPLQLYACLESFQRYVSGFETATVLYRASTEEFSAGYEGLKESFPSVRFIAQTDQPEKDFKANVLKILFNSPSEYVLFGVDDLIVKDFVDLKVCMDWMAKTSSHGFYLRLGRHILPDEAPPSVPLIPGIYAWNFQSGKADWGFPNNLDLTLYRKESLKEAFTKLKFTNPNELEFGWAKKYAPDGRSSVGLYFESSKMVNIPLNIVSPAGGQHMNAFSPDELLTKFNQGLKFDIEPLHQIENGSPRYESIPEFTVR